MLVASIRMGCQQPLTDFVFDNLDNHLNPCYTTQKPHSQAKNTPSPKGCHHQVHVKELEQNSENFVENAHICSKKAYVRKNLSKCYAI